MANPDKNKALEFLYNEGLINRRTTRLSELLGCVGCRWLNAEKEGLDPQFYGMQVIRCKDIKDGVVYPILNRLTDAGVMVRTTEDIDPYTEGRPARIFYYPAPSKLGESFKDKLELPKVCPLELDR